LGGFLARRAGLGLYGVELSARGGQLLDEFLVFGAAFFKLLAKGCDLFVAAAVRIPLDACGSGVEIFGKLADAKAELRFDLRQAPAVLIQLFVGAFAQGAQLLRGYLRSVARHAGPRLGFFHDDAN
jgi:hypothetical protein